MPNLENFRKQAKLYLRWHRERYYPVADAIGSILPRFRHLTDRQILDHGFKLADAQELVARKAGFENWQALKKGLQTMTDRTPPDAAKPSSPLPSPSFSSPTSTLPARSIAKNSASGRVSPMANRPSTPRSSATALG
jgi:hypothetical protein